MQKSKRLLHFYLQRFTQDGFGGVSVQTHVRHVPYPMNFLKYTIYSACGIFIWNGVFISAGYILGEGIFKYIT